MQVARSTGHPRLITVTGKVTPLLIAKVVKWKIAGLCQCKTWVLATKQIMHPHAEDAIEGQILTSPHLELYLLSKWSVLQPPTP